MKSNPRARTTVGVTHEGGPAGRQSALEELTRAVSTCLLWENTFYEKGSEIAARIEELCGQISAEELAALAVRCRTDLKLRHVPLFLVRHLARLHKGALVGRTLAAVLQRPDEMGEFLALYWRDAGTSKRSHGKGQPLSAQVKKGLAAAFPKFSAYQLAKWNRPTAVRLRDVLFLCRAKPTDAVQAEVWKKLAAGALESPDTWEVALSSGADKRETWTRLLTPDGEGRRGLGYIALLMNLRNMAEAKVDPALIETALREGAPTSKALPFRFLSAAKYAPQHAAALSDAMVSVVHGRLGGSTLLVIDVSGSMDEAVSGKSTLNRWEAGAALGILLREVCASCRVFTFSDRLVEVANYRGLPLVDAVHESQPHSGTQLRAALDALKANVGAVDRVIVVTDEQTSDGIAQPWTPAAYLVNVAAYKPGLDTTQGWKRVSGWSERIVDWIALEETGRVLSEDEE